MKNLIKVSFVIVFLVILSGCSYRATRQGDSIINDSAKTIIDDDEAEKSSLDERSEEELANEKVYFGAGSNGEYFFSDIENGEVKAIIPTGYEIISQHSYDIFPDYFILQKDNNLFSFKVEERAINIINNLELGENEKAYTEPSITEKDKFYIVIEEYDPNEELDFGGPSPINTRTYFFDASMGKLTPAGDMDLYSCYKYDSKNERMFTWYCGEGYGYTIPLFISSLDGGGLQEVISTEDYGLQKDDWGSVYVNYNNGAFMALEKNKPTKITVVNPSPKEVIKEVYSISDKVKSQLDDVSTYSVAIDRENNTIVIGQGYAILLLKYNSDKEIVESKYIKEPEVYANFTFPYSGKIIYQSGSNLKIVNTDNWQIEKTIPIQAERREEITLIK